MPAKGAISPSTLKRILGYTPTPSLARTLQKQLMGGSMGSSPSPSRSNPSRSSSTAKPKRVSPVRNYKRGPTKRAPGLLRGQALNTQQYYDQRIPRPNHKRRPVSQFHGGSLNRLKRPAKKSGCGCPLMS